MNITPVTAFRHNICRNCVQWNGSCKLGHNLAGSAACPLGKFGGFVPLGNVVAAVAQPLARVADELLGTHLRQCPGCAKRREKLNHLIPQ